MIAPTDAVRRATPRAKAGGKKVDPKAMSARTGGARPAEPRRTAGVCAVCGRWRPVNGRGHDICDVRIEEEARGRRSARLPDGEPPPSWENVVRALEDDD
jgi:hypothetical protein